MSETTFITRETTVLTPDGATPANEEIAVETPYTVMLNEVDIGTSMVLPAGLAEFAVGFLFGQGYIEEPEQVKEVLVCPEGRISVYADVDDTGPREVIITSGCGGTGTIPAELLEGALAPPLDYAITFPEIRSFVRGVLKASTLGPRTHCVHGCGLWADGALQLFFEDVGRHNAVDKVIGAILLGRASPRAAVYTTGRLTSDMVLKCARMRIPIILSRTAASSLGLAIADRAGVTLAAYARPERLNILTGPERVVAGGDSL